jgi:hypothetical protein
VDLKRTKALFETTEPDRNKPLDAVVRAMRDQVAATMTLRNDSAPSMALRKTSSFRRNEFAAGPELIACQCSGAFASGSHSLHSFGSLCHRCTPSATRDRETC